MIKKISLYLLILLYAVAGVNHFLHPAGYYSIIPPYLPNPHLINILAGAAELLSAVLLIFPGTRKIGCLVIVAMLIAFIPAHIYMIQKGGCMGDQICIPLWGAWLRLIPLQFILIWWAWWQEKGPSGFKNR
ncbi:MAG: MauE/DoxX family redox-associated membrane protein [Ferruginibacter sp.]